MTQRGLKLKKKEDINIKKSALEPNELQFMEKVFV